MIPPQCSALLAWTDHAYASSYRIHMKPATGSHRVCSICASHSCIATASAVRAWTRNDSRACSSFRSIACGFREALSKPNVPRCGRFKFVGVITSVHIKPFPDVQWYDQIDLQSRYDPLAPDLPTRPARALTGLGGSKRKMEIPFFLLCKLILSVDCNHIVVLIFTFLSIRKNAFYI